MTKALANPGPNPNPNPHPHPHPNPNPNPNPHPNPNQVDAAFWQAHWQAVCTPAAVCTNELSHRLPRSEGQEDFFYLSELRLYVLHALGVINWVWY